MNAKQATERQFKTENCIDCKHIEHPQSLLNYQSSFKNAGTGGLGGWCELHKMYIKCTYCTQFESRFQSSDVDAEAAKQDELK